MTTTTTDMLMAIGMTYRFRVSSRMQASPMAHLVMLDEIRYETSQ